VHTPVLACVRCFNEKNTIFLAPSCIPPPDTITTAAATSGASPQGCTASLPAEGCGCPYQEETMGSRRGYGLYGSGPVSRSRSSTCDSRTHRLPFGGTVDNDQDGGDEYASKHDWGASSKEENVLSSWLQRLHCLNCMKGYTMNFAAETLSSQRRRPPINAEQCSRGRNRYSSCHGKPGVFPLTYYLYPQRLLVFVPFGQADTADQMGFVCCIAVCFCDPFSFSKAYKYMYRVPLFLDMLLLAAAIVHRRRSLWDAIHPAPEPFLSVYLSLHVRQE